MEKMIVLIIAILFTYLMVSGSLCVPWLSVNPEVMGYVPVIFVFSTFVILDEK